MSDANALAPDISSATLARVAQLSSVAEHITYKRANTYAERDAIFRMRYACFLRAGLISQNAFARFVQEIDHAPNTYLVGLYYQSRLVSSVRLHVGCCTKTNHPSFRVLANASKPPLRGGRTIVEMSCVAKERGSSALHTWLPYLTLRPWIAAAEHFDAGYIIAATRSQHRPFYQHALGCDSIAQLRRASYFLEPLVIVGLNFANSANRLYQAFAFLRSEPSDRVHLFEQESTALRPAAALFCARSQPRREA